MLKRTRINPLFPHHPQNRTFFSFPTPFSSPPPPTPTKGSLVHKDGISIYQESRSLPYTPRELYSIIADVDSYASFLPFATSSSVLSATRIRSTGQRESTNISGKEWLSLKEGVEGEKWEMQAELRAGAMGFEEGYVSKVEAEKFKFVSARASNSTLFKHLHSSWTLTPLSVPPTAANRNRPNTKVDLYLAYAFSSPLHAVVVSSAWEKVSGMMIDGFEKRLGTIYGKR
ncbi:coenzyme Q-binding protein COQ10, partial [Phenoliferia sp. Uapishka_3]